MEITNHIKLQIKQQIYKNPCKIDEASIIKYVEDIVFETCSNMYGEPEIVRSMT